MLAIQQTDTAIYLTKIRRPDEGERKNFRDPDRMFYGIKGEKDIQLKSYSSQLPTWKVITSRPSIGSVPGCSNSLWECSQEQWDALIAEDVAQQQHPKEARPPFAPIPDEVRALLKQYGRSQRAWDAGDERACMIMRQYNF